MNYPVANRLFTFACFSAPPILGSAVSFLWHGGALWCVFEVASGRRALSRDRDMRRLACLLYLYVFASILSFFLNAPKSADFYQLLPLCTFLLFPFSYSIWSISDKGAIARATALGCMAASYGALVLAVIQRFAEIRPEGGAGNALVFSSVTCMAGAASLAGALMLDTRWRLVLLGGYLASVLAVLYSESRSAWVAMIILFAVVLIACRDQVRLMLRGHLLKAATIVILIGVLSSGVLVSRTENLMADWSEVSETGDYHSSLGFRLALWEIGTSHFFARPLLGNGPQNSQRIISEGLEENFGLDAQFTHFHNGFLTLLVESGLLGGGAVIAVFVLAAWLAVRTFLVSQDSAARFGALALLILVINYGVGGSVNLVLGHDIVDTVFMIFLIVGVFLASGRSAVEKPESTPAASGEIPEVDAQAPVSRKMPAPSTASPAIMPTMTLLPAAR